MQEHVRLAGRLRLVALGFGCAEVRNIGRIRGGGSGAGRLPGVARSDIRFSSLDHAVDFLNGLIDSRSSGLRPISVERRTHSLRDHSPDGHAWHRLGHVFQLPDRSTGSMFLSGLTTWSL
jgi:hypothetical protein